MKKDEMIFGMTKEEIKRQCSVHNLEGDLAQSPIIKGETLEPCIRGAKKIVEDPETLKIVRNILTNVPSKDEIEETQTLSLNKIKHE